MNKIKWSVIGAGGIADRRTIPAILANAQSELCAVMDRVPEVAKTVGEKYGVPYFTTEEEMLKNTDCDAVYIGTPVMCHYEQAMLALKYGKHVFLEKPITLTSAQGKELVDAFKAAGKQITIGYMMKHHNLHEKAQALVADGQIGQVVDVRAQFSCWYPDIEGAWRQKKALGGGGSLMDLGVHCIELIEFVLREEITDVSGYCSTLTFSYEVEDSAVMIFRTKSGTLGHIDVNFNVPDKAAQSKLELYGTKGYIQTVGTLSQTEAGTLTHLYAPQGDYVAQQNNRDAAKPVTYEAEGANLYEKQINHFCDILNSGKPDYFYTDRAVHVQALVDKLYEQN